ncbi:hypothetical protein POVWA2_002960 [Plasmodium ovale wallikeri]|uniref:Uncharacterized protein n=1 Tax=Plasmodium ovale wallikeri TaxID=864142 RepID=A0A1A8YI31_PLAOA|nr:hypothetical protein POVWA1_002790 [Plasmodium ovale wallikeri]SBT31213.1 hypothetical protein POVWA2_002960 [Plasmodium ovale wallikeri]
MTLLLVAYANLCDRNLPGFNYSVTSLRRTATNEKGKKKKKKKKHFHTFAGMRKYVPSCDHVCKKHTREFVCMYMCA